MRSLKLKIIAVFILVLATSMTARAEGLVKKIRCTCYCEPGITASGAHTKVGIIAGRKDDLGKVAAIYSIAEDGSIGEFLGYYEFKDTGAGMDSDGDGVGDTIRTGKSVDVFQNTLQDAKAWVKEYGDYVYIVIIDAQG